VVPAVRSMCTKAYMVETLFALEDSGPAST
jgi:hypothetical protein